MVKDINFQSHYQDEIDLIDETIKEIEELYTETKEHFDIVKNSRTKGSLSFVHLQTGNLVSLKNAKFQMLKEKVSIKKSMADMTMKQKASEQGENKDKETIRQLMEALLKNDGTAEVKSIQFEDEETEDVASALNKRINDLEKEGKLKFTDNDKLAKYEKSGYDSPELPSDEEEYEDEVSSIPTKIAVRVINKKWGFVAVDEMGRIVEGAEVPDKKQYKMRLSKVDGEIIAVDQDDRMYEVIK